MKRYFVIDYTPAHGHSEIRALWPELEACHGCRIAAGRTTWEAFAEATDRFDALLIHYADIDAKAGSFDRFRKFIEDEVGPDRRVEAVVGFSGGTQWKDADSSEHMKLLEPYCASGRFIYCRNRAEIEAWFCGSDPAHEARLRLLYAMLDEDESAIAAALGDLKTHAAPGLERNELPAWSDRAGVRALRLRLFADAKATAP